MGAARCGLSHCVGRVRPPGASNTRNKCYAHCDFFVNLRTQDHGPINTWNRQLYTNGDGSVAAGWIYISNNAILNGPSPNRDLGNLFPAVDNDDGSERLYVSSNVAIFGGMKNYLGQDKVWDGNLIVLPE